MPEITMYVSPMCAFCSRAKRLLDAKGAQWQEIDIAREDGALQQMLERSGGRRTVPQIFIGETHVGGYDELAALEKRGELDPLLAE